MLGDGFVTPPNVREALDAASRTRMPPSRTASTRSSSCLMELLDAGSQLRRRGDRRRGTGSTRTSLCDSVYANADWLGALRSGRSGRWDSVRRMCSTIGALSARSGSERSTDANPTATGDPDLDVAAHSASPPNPVPDATDRAEPGSRRRSSICSLHNYMMTGTTPTAPGTVQDALRRYVGSPKSTAVRLPRLGGGVGGVAPGGGDDVLLRRLRWTRYLTPDCWGSFGVWQLAEEARDLRRHSDRRGPAVEECRCASPPCSTTSTTRRHEGLALQAGSQREKIWARSARSRAGRLTRSPRRWTARLER